MVIDNVKAEILMPIVLDNVAREARIMTDEHSGLPRRWPVVRRARHHVARSRRIREPEDRSIHSNTIEGYFSIFKRGMKGVYQHCGEQHLHRYLAEFEFRYNTRTADGFDDRARGGEAIKGIVGKRLTYAQ